MAAAAARAPRARSSGCWARRKPPLHLTPVTRDRAQAQDWLQRFEGAGLDGVMAKPVEAPYQPGKRAMLKIKHVRTRRLRGGGLPLVQGRATTPSARCCSACTTTPACCSTWA